MFALPDEEEKVLSRPTKQIRLHFDIVNIVHLYVLNILDNFAWRLHLQLLIRLHNLQFVLPAFFGGPSYLAIARYLICLMTFTLLDGMVSTIFDLVRHYAVGWRALVSLAFGCLYGCICLINCHFLLGALMRNLNYKSLQSLAFFTFIDLLKSIL